MREWSNCLAVICKDRPYHQSLQSLNQQQQQKTEFPLSVHIPCWATMVWPVPPRSLLPHRPMTIWLSCFHYWTLSSLTLSHPCSILTTAKARFQSCHLQYPSRQRSAGILNHLIAIRTNRGVEVVLRDNDRAGDEPLLSRQPIGEVPCSLPEKRVGKEWPASSRMEGLDGWIGS